MKSLLLVLLILASGSLVFGQAESAPSEKSSSRESRLTDFLKQIDTNHDGELDAAEVQAAGPRASMIEGLIRRAGLEPKYPIKISDISEAMQKNRLAGPAVTNEPPKFKTLNEILEALPRKPETGDNNLASKVANEWLQSNAIGSVIQISGRLASIDGSFNVEGGYVQLSVEKQGLWEGYNFDLRTSARTSGNENLNHFSKIVQGKMVTLEGRILNLEMRWDKGQGTIQLQMDDCKLISVASDNVSSQHDVSGQHFEAIRRYAGTMLKQNDIDHNGVLEKDRGEWADVRNAASIDADHNGIITLDELAAYYQSRNAIRAKPANLFEETTQPTKPNPTGGTTVTAGTLAVSNPRKFWTGTTDTGVFAVRLDEIHFIQMIEAKSSNPPTWLILILLKTKNDPIPVSFNDAEKAHAAYQSLLQALESGSERAIEGIGRNPRAGLRGTVTIPGEKPKLPEENREKDLLDSDAEQPKATTQPEATRGSGVLRHRLDRTGTSANLGGYQVTDADLEPLEEMPQLQSLFLANSQVDDAGLKHLEVLTNLQSLNLTFTRITDAGLEHLRGLRQLQSLSLHGMGITDAGLANLEGLTQLRSLNLYGTQVSNDWLKNLKNFPELRQLDLGTTGVSDSGLEHLKDLTKLQSLELIWTGIGDAGLNHLEGLTNLESLNLYNTRVTDTGLKSLTGMKKLQSLNLERTNVSDAGIAYLEKLTSLQAIALENTRVTDEGVKKLQQALPKCKINYYARQR